MYCIASRRASDWSYVSAADRLRHGNAGQGMRCDKRSTACVMRGVIVCQQRTRYQREVEEDCKKKGAAGTSCVIWDQRGGRNAHKPSPA